MRSHLHPVVIGLAVPLAIVSALTLAAVSPASAHDYAISSTPSDGSTITELPAEFSLNMSENMLDLDGAGNGFALQIVDGDGRFYGDGCLLVAGAVLSTPAALGAPGAYRMRWQIVSADGHPVSDEYDFTWAPTGATTPSVGSATAPVCGVPYETPTPSAAPEDTGSSVNPAPTSSASPTSSTNDSPATVLLIAGLGVVAAASAAALIVRRRRDSPGA